MFYCLDVSALEIRWFHCLFSQDLVGCRPGGFSESRRNTAQVPPQEGWKFAKMCRRSTRLQATAVGGCKSTQGSLNRYTDSHEGPSAKEFNGVEVHCAEGESMMTMSHD